MNCAFNYGRIVKGKHKIIEKRARTKTRQAYPKFIRRTIENVPNHPHVKITQYYQAKFNNADNIAAHIALFCELNDIIWQELGAVDGFDINPAYYFTHQPNIIQHLKCYDVAHIYVPKLFHESLAMRASAPVPARTRGWKHFAVNLYILDMPIWTLICNIKTNPHIMNFIMKHIKLLAALDRLMYDMIGYCYFGTSRKFILTYALLMSEFDFTFCLSLFQNELCDHYVEDVCCTVALQFKKNNVAQNNLTIDKFLDLIIACDNNRSRILDFIFMNRCENLIDRLLDKKFLKYFSLDRAFCMFVGPKTERSLFWPPGTSWVATHFDPTHDNWNYSRIKKFVELGLWWDAFEMRMHEIINYVEDGETFLDIIFKYSPMQDKLARENILTNFVKKCSTTTILKHFRAPYFEYISVDKVYVATIRWWVNLDLLDYLFENGLKSNMQNLSKVRCSKEIAKKFMEFGLDIYSADCSSISESTQNIINEIIGEECMVTKNARKH